VATERALASAELWRVTVSPWTLGQRRNSCRSTGHGWVFFLWVGESAPADDVCGLGAGSTSAAASDSVLIQGPIRIERRPDVRRG